MKCPTREQIETAVKAKGYKWFENGDYNLNIVGVRNSETLEEVTNKDHPLYNTNIAPIRDHNWKNKNKWNSRGLEKEQWHEQK